MHMYVPEKVKMTQNMAAYYLRMRLKKNTCNALLQAAGRMDKCKQRHWVCTRSSGKPKSQLGAPLNHLFIHALQRACNTGGPGSIPGSGRALEKGMATHSSICQENFMDREAWWATVRGVTKSQTWLSDWHFHFSCVSEGEVLRSEKGDSPGLKPLTICRKARENLSVGRGLNLLSEVNALHLQ